MNVSYYPGCSLESTAKPYDHSTRSVCRLLEVELHEPAGWSCCGSSAALKMDRLLSVSLAANNLALTEKERFKDVLAPCPFCYRRLLSAQQEITGDPALQAKVESTIDSELRGDLKVLNTLDFFRNRVGLERIQSKVKTPLNGLKVLPYYGCYLLKPQNVTPFDDPENPVSMDEILASLGAEVLDWDFKTECCGSGLALSKTEKVVELSARLIGEAVFRSADAIVVVCQLCQANLDMRQHEIGKLHGAKYRVPIVYLTQLMGVAFGIGAKSLGLHRHLVNPQPVLRRYKG
ncbi:MAG: CoB--CoM heterodisulfide reductase iron-sulfur subunit B family protein [Syntrophobacteraceae bacterium]|nr:CoB--CoM heterodisulfide reductase iron-sulfur subunit B family protein [Syntrophobacteraceae bacterium]